MALLQLAETGEPNRKGQVEKSFNDGDSKSAQQKGVNKEQRGQLVHDNCGQRHTDFIYSHFMFNRVMTCIDCNHDKCLNQR
jgi:hypothetical protein